jgi:ElaB/YqjD/DUF883 family membrane-anchored ribosome-binding protein
MVSNVRDTKSAVEEAVDAVNDAAHTASDKISNGIEEATRTASRFGQKLRENGADLQDELLDAGERFSDGAKRIGDVAAEQIRAHPLAAFGIAFAIGVVATRLMRR